MVCDVTGLLQIVSIILMTSKMVTIYLAQSILGRVIMISSLIMNFYSLIVLDFFIKCNVRWSFFCHL